MNAAFEYMIRCLALGSLALLAIPQTQVQAQTRPNPRDLPPLPPPILRIKPAPPIFPSVAYENVLLRDGSFYRALTTHPASDGGATVLVGNTPDGKLEEKKIERVEDLPAEQALDAGWFFRSETPLLNAVVALQPTAFYEWPEGESNTNRPFRGMSRLPNFENRLDFVPEGFLALGMGEADESTGFELLHRMENQRFVVGFGSHFLSPLGPQIPWNRITKNGQPVQAAPPHSFVEIEPDFGLVLVSLLPPHRPLLSNAKGAMRRIFYDQTPTNRQLAIVETDAFWLAGRLIGIPSPVATSTSPAHLLLHPPEAPHELIETGKVPLLPGRDISSVFQPDGRLSATRSTPVWLVRLQAGHLLYLLEHGWPSELEWQSWAAPTSAEEMLESLSDEASPEDLPGMAMPGGLVSTDGLHYQGQDRGIIRLHVQKPLPQKLRKYFERHRPKLAAAESPSTRPPREEVQLELDGDGTLCLGNGKQIFWLRPVGDNRLEVQIFEVHPRQTDQ